MNRRLIAVINFCKHANAVFIIVLAFYFLLCPGFAVVSSLLDPNLR